MEDTNLFERIGSQFVETFMSEEFDEQRLLFPTMKASGAYFIDYLCMEYYAYTHVNSIPAEDVDEMLNECAIDFGEDFDIWPDLMTVMAFREMPVIYWANMVDEMAKYKLIVSQAFINTITHVANSIIYMANVTVEVG